jgi:aminoglycoside phosphotransferase (APT) family kinase protein
LNFSSWFRCRTKMIEIDTTLVNELIRTQFPQWAELPITPVDNRGQEGGADHPRCP